MLQPEPPTNVERTFELERIVFFSDAVFAIAITLLAIELKVPDLGADQTTAHLLRAILDQWSHLLAFALSFWIIAVYWLAHHRYYRFIIGYDGGLIGRNLLILFFIALMPFTTLVLGEYGNLAGALWLYALNMLALGLAGAWFWHHATYKHRLVRADLDENLIRYIQARAFATPIAAVLVIGLSFVIGGAAGIGWLLIWVFQILMQRRYRTKGIS